MERRLYNGQIDFVRIIQAGNTNRRGRLCTDDLLIKVAGFEKVNNVCSIKTANLKRLSTRRSTVLSHPFK
jgi:hypothetical protein